MKRFDECEPFSYLKDYEPFFFDVEKNKEIKAVIDESLKAYSALISAVSELESRVIESVNQGRVQGDGFIETVLIFLLRKLSANLDAISTLYSKSILIPSQLILRSLVENAIYIEFIVDGDVEERASAYYLHPFYEEMEIMKNQNNRNMLSAESVKLWKKKEAAIQSLIKSRQSFVNIDNKRSQKGKFVNWYGVCGIGNFKDLMKKMGYGNRYDAIYKGTSLETHAANATKQLKVDGSDSEIALIRSPLSGGTVFSLASTFVTGCLDKMADYLGDEALKTEFLDFKVDYYVHHDKIVADFDRIKD